MWASSHLPTSPRFEVTHMAFQKLQPAVLEELQRHGEQVELRDQSGHLCGFFLSPKLYTKLLYQYAINSVTEDELERVRKQPGGHTTEEVLARLKSSK